MKPWLLALTATAILTACSTSNESKQLANDSYAKRGELPTFTTLDTGGVTILGQEKTYQLPVNINTKAEALDIRPPSVAMAIIGDSYAQFDGERASIVYGADKQRVYNIEQIQRLLNEQGIKFNANGKQVITDWTTTGRADDIGNTQVRYIIEEINAKDASALVVAISEIKRNDIIFTPTVTDKERYSSDRLNQWIGELNNTYRTQQQQVAMTTTSGIQTAIITDPNHHLALAMASNFRQSWEKLGQALAQLGFESQEEIAGRGYRVLKYKPLEATEWARLGISKPALEKGEYFMQLSAYGKESAVVISNEDKQALNGEAGQSLYQALQTLLAK